MARARELEEATAQRDEARADFDRMKTERHEQFTQGNFV